MRIHAARLHACSVCRYLFRQRSLHAKRQLRRGEFGHHIGSNARGKRSDAPVAGRAEPARKRGGHNAFFAVDDWIFSIRRKAHHGEFFALFHIMFNTERALFLVQAKDDADAA